MTSHSPDLLDNDEISADSIVAVVLEHGETRIGPLDEVGRSALRERLYTAGELLRMNQLDPDPEASRLTSKQINLFGPGVRERTALTPEGERREPPSSGSASSVVEPASSVVAAYMTRYLV